MQLNVRGTRYFRQLWLAFAELFFSTLDFQFTFSLFPSLSLLSLTKATGTKAMNTVMSTLYGEGFFIHWTKAEKIGKLWLLFLQKYALCARLVYRLGRSRFALVPKLHMLHHGCMRLLREAEQAKKNGTRWTVNPLGESVQQQEDFIGKPSRLSRRVSAKQIHARVCKRSLSSTMQCLKEADEDKRGLFFLRNVR